MVTISSYNDFQNSHYIAPKITCCIGDNQPLQLKFTINTAINVFFSNYHSYRSAKSQFRIQNGS